MAITVAEDYYEARMAERQRSAEEAYASAVLDEGVFDLFPLDAYLGEEEEEGESNYYYQQER